MIERPPDGDRREPGLPEVELAHAFDDDADPRYVTVYPAHRTDVTTTWLTVDVEHAVDLAEMA